MTRRPNNGAHSVSSYRAPVRCPAAGATTLARVVGGFALVLTTTAITVGGPAADTLAQALTDSTDVTVLLRRAESGDARAAFVLGMRYARPDDDSRDDTQAVRWLRRAAEQGLAEAQYNLGIMYAAGRGVARDPAQAAHWYLQAAEQDLASAQYNLGAMYAVGDGVSRDEKHAATWFERAALQDVPEAAYNLGVLYDLGRGVEADAATAMQWYERAADGGYHPAASRLAALRAANPSLVAASSAPTTQAMQTATKLPPDDPAKPLSTESTARPVPAPSAAPIADPDATSSATSAAVHVVAEPMAADARSASPWLARLDSNHYTLQVLSHTDEASVRRYLNENFGDGEAGYFAFELDGETWFSVVYGDYASYSQAATAGESLAGRIQGLKPWVRKLAIIQKAAIR